MEFTFVHTGLGCTERDPVFDQIVLKQVDDDHEREKKSCGERKLILLWPKEQFIDNWTNVPSRNGIRNEILYSTCKNHAQSTSLDLRL